MQWQCRPSCFSSPGFLRLTYFCSGCLPSAPLSCPKICERNGQNFARSFPGGRRMKRIFNSSVSSRFCAGLSRPRNERQNTFGKSNTDRRPARPRAHKIHVHRTTTRHPLEACAQPSLPIPSALPPLLVYNVSARASGGGRGNGRYERFEFLLVLRVRSKKAWGFAEKRTPYHTARKTPHHLVKTLFEF